MDDETPQQRTKRLNRERQQRHRMRLAQNPIENAAKRVKHAEREQLRRDHESQEQNRIRLESVAATTRLHRDRESQEENRARLESNALSHRLRRDRETQEENRARLLLLPRVFVETKNHNKTNKSASPKLKQFVKLHSWHKWKRYKVR